MFVFFFHFFFGGGGLGEGILGGGPGGGGLGREGARVSEFFYMESKLKKIYFFRGGGGGGGWGGWGGKQKIKMLSAAIFVWHFQG